MRRTIIVLTTTALAGAGVVSAAKPILATARPAVVEATSTTAARTSTGRAVSTPYGAVKVRITYRGKNISTASAVEYPSDNPHSSQISSYAVPRLNHEAAKKNDAAIAMVSGATYTSVGYKKSLQSALNRAGI